MTWPFFLATFCVNLNLFFLQLLRVRMLLKIIRLGGGDASRWNIEAFAVAGTTGLRAGLKAKRAINSQPHSWRPGQSHRTGWTTLASWSRGWKAGISQEPSWNRTMANSEARACSLQLTVYRLELHSRPDIQWTECAQNRLDKAARSINRALFGPYQLRSVFAARDFAFFFFVFQPPS